MGVGIRRPQGVRMTVTSPPAGLGQRSMLAGDSTWVMTYSASRRETGAGTGGVSPGWKAAVPGNVPSAGTA